MRMEWKVCLNKNVNGFVYLMVDMQIMSKRQQSEELYDNTQWMIKKIDDLEAGRLELINEEIRLQQQIKNLNQV